MPDTDWAQNYLKNTDFSNINIISHHTGESNHNYIFESEGNKYVLRTNLEEKGSTNRLNQERKILEFLETQNIDFAPKSVYYDKENQIHITSFLGTKDVELTELNSEQLKEWIKHLVTIHSLDFKDYRQFCEDNNYAYEEPETNKQSLQKYGFEKFEYAQKNLDKKKILAWTEEKLSEIAQNMEENQDARIGLSHGDIANNTRFGEGKIYFIDWELARFSHNPAGSLSYAFIHEELNQELYERVKELYKEETGIENLDKELKFTEKMTRINDVIWALKRAAKLQEKNNSEWKEYFELAKERKSLFQDRFSN